ncbi:hypothetical protein PCANC_24764 [Puccinia coronata f. sp. avenae]|uniref:Tet-like 2OG-Fe(II) oxygenase domain-containing protein n=1 Tax=Puccinia coronata f. sp. avenae TaxID=200324 RepID=A0A2N5TVQ2_9BASI|nr:hypothetical protein PCANC_24764 [Puccinia coronata f. sp. avenae]
MGFRKIPSSSFASGHPDQPNPFAHVLSAKTGEDHQFVVFTLFDHLILPPIPLSLQPGSCAQFKYLFRRDMTPQTAGGAGTKNKKRRPFKAIHRWQVRKERAAAPFASSNSSAPPDNLPTNEGHPQLPEFHTTPAAHREDDPTAAADSTTEPPPADNCTSPNSQPVTNGEHVYHYQVPPQRQHDPFRAEIITSQSTLQHYHRIFRGTCIIAPRSKEAFCKVQFFPFKTMSDDLKLGWEQLVCHFLQQVKHVDHVKTNGPHCGGVMFADGWRKSSTRGEGFGRYCCKKKLKKMIAAARYNPRNEAEDIREANDFIATQLNQLAPGFFEAYRKELISKKLPSMAHMEYDIPYSPFDFSSFITFTMYDFFNKPHINGDENKWTLVCWIPIFHPLNSPLDSPTLADDGFDMVGGGQKVQIENALS